MIIVQCVYVKCSLEGKARFDAGTNQAASRSDTEAQAEMKAEEKFLGLGEGGRGLGMEFQAEETGKSLDKGMEGCNSLAFLGRCGSCCVTGAFSYE